MIYLFFIPFLVQAFVIGFDEFYFHIKRDLPKWERIGHPLDTLTVLACFLFALFVPFSALALKFYIALALFSCIFVTKDEFVHKECCPASEQWLHSLLFLNHPVILTAVGLAWPVIQAAPLSKWLGNWLTFPSMIKYFLISQTLFIFAFFLYQVVYWNIIRREKTA